MEYRKIIEFGKSSYVISLPKPWLAEKKLGKGDVVYLSRQGDNMVVYPAQESGSTGPKSVSIDVTDMSKDDIRLQIISKYVLNYNEIILTSDNMHSKAKDVRAIIHDIMALEVVEETASKIVTKDFIHMEEISPMELLQKMDNITREMMSDSKNSFEDDRHSNIAERDTDVNRLTYLLNRTLRHYQQNPIIARKRGLKHTDFLPMWIAADKIEGIADDIKRISKLIPRLKFKKQEQEHFCKLYSMIEKYYLDSMQAFYAKDRDAAFKLIPQKKRLIKQCRDFYRQSWNHEWAPIILEKFKSMIAGTKDILVYVCDQDLNELEGYSAD